MDFLPKKGYKIHPESYLCKVVFKSGKISYHLFDKFSFAKKYSESVSKKFDCVAYCELLPFNFSDPLSLEAVENA